MITAVDASIELHVLTMIIHTVFSSTLYFWRFKWPLVSFACDLYTFLCWLISLFLIYNIFLAWSTAFVILGYNFVLKRSYIIFIWMAMLYNFNLIISFTLTLFIFI